MTASRDGTARLWRLRRPEGWRGIAFHPLAFGSLACLVLLGIHRWLRRRDNRVEGLAT